MKATLVTAVFAVALALIGSTVAGAADHQVKMLNKGASGAPMVFEPSFLAIEPGDSVTFVPTDKGHDAQSIKGMMPDGAAPFVGKMNQQVTVGFDTGGVYGVKCAPHYGLGMVALIVVGNDASNLAAAQAVKQPGKAKQAFASLFDQLNTVLAGQ
ncbi:MAG: pseudoazurin [Bauldia sp.]